MKDTQKQRKEPGLKEENGKSHRQLSWTHNRALSYLQYTLYRRTAIEEVKDVTSWLQTAQAALGNISLTCRHSLSKSEKDSSRSGSIRAVEVQVATGYCSFLSSVFLSLAEQAPLVADARVQRLTGIVMTTTSLSSVLFCATVTRESSFTP
ncbi:uncharacterized protein V6R79_003064 [Siganus canaliculatus]